MNDGLKKGIIGSAVGAIVAGLSRTGASAQDSDTAAAGNGGTADASANGGAVSIGDLNSGLNSGGLVGVGDVWDGAVAIEGSDVTATTTVGISANGGTAISDASGGDGNFAATTDVFAFVS